MTSPSLRRALRVLRRAAGAVVVLVVVISAVFFALPLSGGDAARARLGTNASTDAVAELTRQLGLDRPLIGRWWDWLTHAVQGDLGRSYLTDLPVGELVAQRLPPTLALVGFSLLITLPAAALLGVWVGLRPARPDGRIVAGAGLVAAAVPEFVLAAVLVSLLAVRLRLLPAVSSIPPGASVFDRPERLVLPVLTLTVAAVGYLSRLVAAGVRSASASDAVEAARLNGVAETRVVRLWILPLAVRAVVPAAARTVAFMIGGTLVVESVFGLPGLSKLLVDSVNSQDAPVVLGVVLVLAVATIALNLLADVIVDATTPAAARERTGVEPQLTVTAPVPPA